MSSGRPLTEPAYWDGFWDATSLPVLPDPAKRYERCFIELFDRFFTSDPAKTVFEAGCAPGMWLSHFHRRYGYRPTGCDTSERGVALTRENFRLLGVPGEVHRRDLLSYAPARAFDAVLSLGFIEHFSDPWPVLDAHARLLAPGGLLVLEVPNLTGLNAWLSAPELLALHNCATMRPDFLREAGRRLGLELLHLDYLGGFEPDNLAPPRAALGRRILLKGLRALRALPGAGTLQSPRFSAFLAAVMRKPKS